MAAGVNSAALHRETQMGSRLKQWQLLEQLLVAAAKYVQIVNNPVKAPHHKQTDAERQAFDEMEQLVAEVLACKKEAFDEAKKVMDEEPELGTFSNPEEGAWS